METYLLLYFYSKGTKPLDIVKKLEALRFKPGVGRYDMKYVWDKMPSPYDIVELGNKIADLLEGDNVIFKLESK